MTLESSLSDLIFKALNNSPGNETQLPTLGPLAFLLNEVFLRTTCYLSKSFFKPKVDRVYHACRLKQEEIDRLSVHLSSKFSTQGKQFNIVWQTITFATRSKEVAWSLPNCNAVFEINLENKGAADISEISKYP